MKITKSTLLELLSQIPTSKADDEIALLVWDGDDNHNCKGVYLNSYDSGYDLEVQLEDNTKVVYENKDS
jgi:hypothetical protein